MSGSERAVIYVDSGVSSLNSMNSSSSSPVPPSHQTKGKIKSPANGNSMSSSNYVIKIQIGEEGIYNRPVRIDVAGPHHHRQRQIIETMPDNDSLPMLDSSGQSSPRSDITPPPHFNGSIKGTRHTVSLSRFGSETSESDTESDISTEYPHTMMTSQHSLNSNTNFGRINSNSKNIGQNLSPKLSRPLSMSPCSAAQFARREILDLGSGVSDGVDDKNIYYQGTVESSNENVGPINNNGRSVPQLSVLASLKENLNQSLIKAFTEHEKIKIQPSCSNNLENCDVMVRLPVSDDTREIEDVNRINHYNQLTLCKIPESRPPSSIQIDQTLFHMHEFQNEKSEIEMIGCTTEGTNDTNSLINFVGYKDIFSRVVQEGPKQIMSEKGTIRGVRNRVRDGIATFLQTSDAKNFNEKEEGRVVVYVTSMGVVRHTYQRCQKVKQILRNLLIKFDERDCYMNQAVQAEIRDRILNKQRKKEILEQSGLPLPVSLSLRHPTSPYPHHSQKQIFNFISLPQVFIEGQYLGGVDIIEKLNETGELRKLLQPYKNVSVLTTCENCGGFRMLPCPVCNGSKKSVHRNHFTEEFVALKCMHCDQAGLIKCHICNL